MAPSTPAAEKDDSHQILLDQMDMASQPKPFRSQTWKPSQRRNKNLKQILGESQRKEASVLATQNNSGASTPYPASTAQGTDGALTPQVNGGTSRQPNIAQAAQSLSSLVLERNLRATLEKQQATGPAVTYTNIESAPSLHPAHQRHYCDITGLLAPYRDPKTRLRYHNREIFGVVRTLGQGTAERYLEARGAHVVLK